MGLHVLDCKLPLTEKSAPGSELRATLSLGIIFSTDCLLCPYRLYVYDNSCVELCSQ